jgi:putative regulator of septum formation
MGRLGLRLVVIGIFVVGGILFRDRLSGDANDLRVGDCFEEPALTQTIEDVQHQPCGEVHDSEVVWVGTHPAAKGAAVPSDEGHRAWIATTCLPAFTAYTGIDLLSQEVLTMGYFVPTDDSWQEGDRKIICYAVRMDGQAMTQSVRTAR